jgi:hypothetical protein
MNLIEKIHTKSWLSGKIQKMLRIFTITILSIVYVLLILAWVPGLLATIMMSDSGEKIAVVELLMMIWITYPITILCSLTLLVKGRSLFVYFYPVFHLMIYFLVAISIFGLY